MEVARHVGYGVHLSKLCLNKGTYRVHPSLSPRPASSSSSPSSSSSSYSVACASASAAARERGFNSRPGMGDEEVKREALGILNSAQALPTLFVFDLDYTLWPFYCECRSKRDNPRLYPQAMGILNALKEKEITMAVASRSPTPDIANAFLQKLGLVSLFVDMEIFSSWTNKIEHFRNIQQKTGVPFNSMLFFDDENGNIEAVSKLGVTCILVHDGVNIEALKKGLGSFANSVSR